MLSPSTLARGLGRTALAAAVAAVAFGCAPEPAKAKPPWPEGTVVVLDGEPITAAEVDQYVDAMKEIDASFTKPHCRRLVLTSIIFYRAFARAHPDRPREEARAEATEWRRKLLAGELVGPLVEPRSGNWDLLGVEYWLALREMEPGEWSDVIELSGRFAVLQLISRDHAPRGGQEWFETRIVEFPYVDHPELLQNRITDAVLEIVDPAWQEIVPGYWKYELR